MKRADAMGVGTTPIAPAFALDLHYICSGALIPKAQRPFLRVIATACATAAL